MITAAEEEDLVVHARAEDDAEDDHQQRRFGVYGAEKIREVSLLEVT